MQDEDLKTQIDYLEEVLSRSDVVSKVLKLTPELKLPDWYLGAGTVAQTVWNELHGLPPEHGIKDCDIAYFDSDTSYEAEDVYIQKGAKLFDSLPVEIEIRNQARVHLWYKQKRGREIRQFTSTEDAINTWPTTSTSVGVRYEGDRFVVYAPYGLHDLLGMVVRPNKTLLTQKVYEDKAGRWQKAWPKLTIVPWDR